MKVPWNFRRQAGSIGYVKLDFVASVKGLFDSDKLGFVGVVADRDLKELR